MPGAYRPVVPMPTGARHPMPLPGATSAYPCLGLTKVLEILLLQWQVQSTNMCYNHSILLLFLPKANESIVCLPFFNQNLILLLDLY